MAEKIKRLSKKIIVFALMLAMALSSSIVNKTDAAALSSLKDTISDSRIGQDATHVITFVTTDSLTAGETIVITFDPDNSDFNFTDVTATDVSASAGMTVVGSCGGGASEVTVAVNTSLDTVTYTVCATDTVAAGTITTTIGGANKVANPGSIGTEEISVVTAAGTPDSGSAMVAIVEGVTVSATVAETLTFTIGAVLNADCDTSFSVLDGPASTSTTVPFGTLASSNTFYHACQDLTVSTNATGGYTITAEEASSLLSGSDTIDDSIGNTGTMDESTENPWSTTSVNGFGYSCHDEAGSDCVMTAETQYKRFACTGADAVCDPGTGGKTKQSVMTSGDPVSANVGRIEYKINIGGTQEAGTYQNTITYIATPTY